MDLLFEYRNCPSCGQNDFEVLFGSNMKTDDFNVLFDYRMGAHESQEGTEGYLVPRKEWGRYVKCKNCHLIYMNPMEKASNWGKVLNKIMLMYPSSLNYCVVLDFK